MNGVKRTAQVGRRTRRAPDSVLALQLIRAGFEPLFSNRFAQDVPDLCARSKPALNAATRKAPLKPGAVASGIDATPWARRGFRPTILSPDALP
jgi:hypothetical protein